MSSYKKKDADQDDHYERVNDHDDYKGVSSTSSMTTTVAVKEVKGYKFDMVDNIITAVYKVKGAYSYQERIDADELWSVSGVDVVKTEQEHGVTEITTYTDTDGDGIFVKSTQNYHSNVNTSNLSDVYYDGDHWSGSNSDDYYYATMGNDSLGGSYGDDDLYGGDGDDILIGGYGADDLHGGAGSDIFKFSKVSESDISTLSRDVIYDFISGVDKIDVSLIDAVSGNKSNDSFKFVGTLAQLTKANANGALWFENSILYGSNDRDMTAEFHIELSGVSSLQVTDILL